MDKKSKILIIITILLIFFLGNYKLNYYDNNNIQQQVSIDNTNNQTIPHKMMRVTIPKESVENKDVLVIEQKESWSTSFREIADMIMAIIVTIVFLPLSLWIVYNEESSNNQRNWACGIIGGMLGFWLK